MTQLFYVSVFIYSRHPHKVIDRTSFAELKLEQPKYLPTGERINIEKTAQ